MGTTTTFAHEFVHLQGCQHDDGYESPSTVTFTYVDNQTYNDYYITIMKTSNTKSAADNTSLSEVWKFSTPNQTINTTDNLTVNCSRHVPDSGGGTSHDDYTCRFSSEASLGDYSSTDCLSKVKASINTFPYFR